VAHTAQARAGPANAAKANDVAIAMKTMGNLQLIEAPLPR
jgi:hypothetical protein